MSKATVSLQLGTDIKQLIEQSRQNVAVAVNAELTLLYNDLELLKKEQKLTPEMVFRDPYFLDFLGLKDTYSEKDLETSILAQLQNFILEFGSDFAFMARQKRITIDQDDYYIDLLFYHRKLKRLIAIELLCGAQHNKSYVA